MKNRFPALTAVGLLFVGSLWADSNAKIQTGGQLLLPEKAAIVLPDVASAQENYAADDLAKHLKLITGAEFAKVSESSFNGPQGFYLGNTRKAAACGINLKELGEEGIHLKTDGASLILAGGKRGVIYAVSVFLEDALGCRWFAPDCATWPTRGTIDVPKLDRRYLPPLEFRSSDLGMVRSDDNVPRENQQAHNEYAVHLRLNGYYNNRKGEMGGFHYIGKTHELTDTFFQHVPPDKYFKTHPEYFSLVRGNRQPIQLCLTNPDVVDIVADSIRKQIRENPESRIFSIAQQDGEVACGCEKCTALVDAEGSQSGPIIHFLNTVSDTLKKDHPDIFLLTDAYAYSVKPPKKVKARPNVIVCFATFYCRFDKPITEGSPAHAEYLRKWAQCCETIYVYDYNTDFNHYLLPFPNFNSQKPNLQLYLENKVKGVFQQSCPFLQGEFNALRAYVTGKLLWDPSYDPDKAISDFCGAYYGPAAPMIQEYIRLFHQAAARSPAKGFGIYAGYSNHIYPDTLADAEKLLDRADTAVKNSPEFSRHVDLVRLSLLYTQLYIMRTKAKIIERDGKLVSEGVDAAIEPKKRRFETIANREKLHMLAEGGETIFLTAFLDSLPRPVTCDIAELRNADLNVQILPGYGGRIFRMTWLPTGRDILKIWRSFKEGDDFSRRKPMEGGYEERMGLLPRSPGMSEPYTILSKTANAITLEGITRDGACKITRVYELDQDKPVLHIISTFANNTDKARQITPYITAVFKTDLADAAEKRKLHIWQRDGKLNTVDLGGPGFSVEYAPWLKNLEEGPNGQWAIELKGSCMIPTWHPGNTNVQWDKAETDLTLVHRFGFDGEQVGRAWRRSSPSDLHLSIEVNARTLQPGKSFTFKQSLEVKTTEKLFLEK